MKDAKSQVKISKLCTIEDFLYLLEINLAVICIVYLNFYGSAQMESDTVLYIDLYSVRRVCVDAVILLSPS